MHSICCITKVAGEYSIIYLQYFWVNIRINEQVIFKDLLPNGNVSTEQFSSCQFNCQLDKFRAKDCKEDSDYPSFTQILFRSEQLTQLTLMALIENRIWPWVRHMHMPINRDHSNVACFLWVPPTSSTGSGIVYLCPWHQKKSSHGTWLQHLEQSTRDAKTGDPMSSTWWKNMINRWLQCTNL